MTYNTDLFDEMVADVMTLTARPDLAGETALAVRTATNNVHFCDAFPRDLQSTIVQLPIASYVAQLDIPTLFPRLRGLSAVKQLDVSGMPLAGREAGSIEVVELADIYDDYNEWRSNIAYVAGDKINVKANILSPGFLVEWFKAPATKREQYNSWIAVAYPDVILYWAASLVLSTNGNEEKAQKYMQLTQQIHVPYLKANFLLGAII